MSENEKRIQKPQTYVVQLEVQHETDGAYWVDLATVTVPPRTPRRTVIKRALAEADVKPGGAAPRVRVLDADSAEVHEPEAHQPPMEWRLP